jgi:tripartite-type tricarboxylate transporter receptor subunit TctC
MNPMETGVSRETRRSMSDRTYRAKRAVFRIVLAASSGAALVHSASAHNRDVTFAGKTITMTIGNAPGGQTDLYGRLFARYLTKYLPGNPDLVVSNQPGAEGVSALNSWVIRAKRDGTDLTIGAGTQTNPLYYRDAHARYDLEKFKFVGGTGAPGGALFVSKAAEARLHDKSLPPVIMGALSAVRGNMFMTVWGAMFLGWNAKWVVGYADTPSLKEALSRGEIDMSSFGSLSDIQALTAADKFDVVAQEGRIENGKLAIRPAIGNAPIFANLIAGKIDDPKAREAFAYWETSSQIGQWAALPPDTPAAIVEVYRKATDAVFKDPEYRRQAIAVVSDGVSVAPADLEAMVQKLDRTPDDVFAYLEGVEGRLGMAAARN